MTNLFLWSFYWNYVGVRVQYFNGEKEALRAVAWDKNWQKIS